MSKKITFTAKNKTEFLTHIKPYPASQAIPDWWKNMTPFDATPENPQGKKFLLRNRVSNATFKRCTPMLDSMVTGYIIPLWADVQVTQTEEFPFINWRTRQDIFELHGPSSRKIPSPPGYDQVVFKYINTWIPKTPKGYSCLVTSPNGYQDLPFKAVPAIIDTDKSTLELAFPMWIKTGLEGIVEAGTPLIQIIPFKRDDWSSDFNFYEDNEYIHVVEESGFNRHILSHYKQNVWSKKKFE